MRRMRGGGCRTSRRTLRLGFGPVVALSLLAAGCDDPAGPPFPEPIALVRMHGSPEQDQMHRLLAIGLHSHQALGWSPNIMFRIGSTVLSPDGERLYAMGVGPSGWTESQIAVVDTRTLAVTHREFFADSGGYRRDRFKGLGIDGTGGLLMSPDGGKLFIAASRGGDSLHPSAPGTEYGIAVLDAATLEALDFIGPYAQGAFISAVIPPGAFRPEGVIAFATPDSAWPHVVRNIRFANAATLAVFDSADVSGALGERDGILDMVAAPHGQSLYLHSLGGWVLKYDLVARQVTARAREPVPGRLTVAPDGARLYVARGWTQDAPSSGVIAVYDADLNGLAPIDLSDIAVPQLDATRSNSPALNMVAVAPNEELLVATGAMLAQLWGFQSGRVFFVDPSSHEVLDVIKIGGELAASEILVP